jgi:molecular chaperone GrpE (heat shock protein)
MPFLLEYRAAVRFAEANELTTVVAQVQQLRSIGEQVRLATSQWQSVHEHSGKTVAAAKEVMERMVAEAQAFADFMQKANDSEKSHLRLEVEKLRRSEGDWLQVAVRMLDHIYALTLAGMRSGQPGLREQLGKFQFACYDAARRIGLVPLEAKPGEAFDTQTHQLPSEQEEPPVNAVVAETLATGYTFQGQVLRLPVVSVTTAQAATVPVEEFEPEAIAEPSAMEAGLISTEEQTPALAEAEEFRLETEA